MSRPRAGTGAAALLPAFVLAAGLCAPPAAAATAQELLAQADHLAADDDHFPEPLRRALPLYEQAATLGPQNPLPLLRLSKTCLDLGQAATEGRIAWYERGLQAAERALAVKEDNADAHFYVAANRGLLVEQLPFWKVSPTVLADLERHLLRALALEPRHAGALHMMGRLLNQVPGPLRLLMVGKKEQVEDYLKRAAAAEPRSAEVHWSLADYYREKGRPAEAREHAQAILALTNPTDRRDWLKTFRPQAEALLKTLDAP